MARIHGPALDEDESEVDEEDGDRMQIDSPKFKKGQNFKYMIKDLETGHLREAKVEEEHLSLSIQELLTELNAASGGADLSDLAFQKKLGLVPLRKRGVPDESEI
jgi:hypothetical protein